MIVNANEFTAMKGHVAHGCVILNQSGKRFTLENTIRGWRVLDHDGAEISGNLPSAFDVEVFIVNRIGA
jgi:hypothetical protein